MKKYDKYKEGDTILIKLNEENAHSFSIGDWGKVYPNVIMEHTAAQDLEALHAMNTYDIIDVLTSNTFTSEEKKLASTIAKDRFGEAQIKISNFLCLTNVGRD